MLNKTRHTVELHDIGVVGGYRPKMPGGQIGSNPTAVTQLYHTFLTWLKSSALSAPFETSTIGSTVYRLDSPPCKRSITESIDEHRLIAKCILDGDEEGAVMTMQGHSNRGRDDLVRFVENLVLQFVENGV